MPLFSLEVLVGTKTGAGVINGCSGATATASGAGAGAGAADTKGRAATAAKKIWFIIFANLLGKQPFAGGLGEVKAPGKAVSVTEQTCV